MSIQKKLSYLKPKPWSWYFKGDLVLDEDGFAFRPNIGWNDPVGHMLVVWRHDHEGVLVGPMFMKIIIEKEAAP